MKLFEYAYSSFYSATLCYSAVYAGFLCPAVCMSVRHKPVLYRNYWTNRAGFFFAGRLTSTYPTLCCKESLVSPKFGSYFWDCPKLRTWKFSPRQVDRVVNKTRRRRSNLLTTPIRQPVVMAVYYKSVNCKPLTPLLRFIVDLSYNLFL